MKRIALALALLSAGAFSALAQNVTVIGPITPGNCPQFNSTTVIKDSGFNCNGSPAISFASPTATAGPSAVNGSAATAMRSDAAPAVQKGTNSQFGIVEGDGATIDCSVTPGICIAKMNGIFPTPTRAGDIIYWNGSAWVTLAGNNSGTNCFQENASGAPSFSSCGGAANFTGDNPPSAGTAGLVPAPPSGSTAANELLGAGGAFVQRKPLFNFAVPAPFQTTALIPSTYALAVAPSVSLGTSGLNSTTMTLTPSDLYQNIARSLGASQLNAYVDPVNGTDTGTTCAQSAPCKTLQYCFTNCTAGNIIGIPTGPFSPFSFDSATAATAAHTLTFTGPATIRLNGSPYIDPSAMTFTQIGSTAVYTATLGLTGSQAVQRFTSSNQYDVGTGNLTRYTNYPTLSALQTASAASPTTIAGWNYTSGTLAVAFFNANVNTSKTSFRAFYLDTNGNSQITVQGTAILLIAPTYQLNLDGVGIVYQNTTTSLPTLLVDGRGLIKQFVSPGFGTLGIGGFLYVSGMDCEASQSDCWNINPPSSGTTIGYAIGHNIKGWYAGDIETFGTAISQANNGWSAHGGANDMIVGSSFGKNFGPNIADTVTAGYNNSSWLVGVETTQVTDPSGDAGIGFFGDAGQPTGLRTAWVDTCATMQEIESLTSTLPNITVKQTNCSLNVPAQAIAGGALVNYTRNSP